MTIYYVRPTNGLDTNGGTTFGAAFQTTQKALDTAIGGDEIRLCNEATETPSAVIDVDTNAGSAASPIVVWGADSVDGSRLTSGHYTISGSSLPATTDLMFFNINNLYIQFNRVRWTAATQDGWGHTGAQAHFIDAINCRIDTCSTDGIDWTGTTGHVRLLNCEIDSNTGQGIDVNAGGRLNCDIIGGSIHDNGGIGAEIGGDASSVCVAFCEIYDNGGDGIQFTGDGYRVIGCTIYGNSSDGLAGNAAVRGTIINTSSSGNTAYGFQFTTTGADFLMMDYNHTHNNTSGTTDLVGGMPGDNNQTGDPLFTSVTDGSEDFTPGSGSPLLNNGV